MIVRLNVPKQQKKQKTYNASNVSMKSQIKMLDYFMREN